MPCRRALAVLRVRVHTVRELQGEEEAAAAAAEKAAAAAAEKAAAEKAAAEKAAAAAAEKAARCCRCSDGGMHAWCGHATVMVLVSSASGTHVSGCIRAPRTPNYDKQV
jgi:hypothetical protein